MRVAVLWTRPSGYLNACLRALAEQGDEVFFSCIATDESAPFSRRELSWLGDRLAIWTSIRDVDFHRLSHTMGELRPDVALVSGWSIKPYLDCLRRLRSRTVRVLAMDNQWRGTARQVLGVATAPWRIHPYFDAAFVPGERQFQFALKLGFKETQILRGLLVADHSAFARAALPFAERNRTFAYVGRLAPEKGIQTLVDAYLTYRSRSDNPWPLILFGLGPLKRLLEGVPGIELHGFVQPNDLPEQLAKQGCLVLPSIFEPWGLAINEAAAAGLPVICTSSCGASIHLVCDGFNGLIVEPGNAEMLAFALAKIAAMPESELSASGRASQSLSEQFTPRRWANYLRGRVRKLQSACTPN